MLVITFIIKYHHMNCIFQQCTFQADTVKITTAFNKNTDYVLKITLFTTALVQIASTKYKKTVLNLKLIYE